MDRQSRPAPTPERARREPYVQPRLVRLGDLRSLTLGGSPGFGDSGPSGTQFNPLIQG